MKKIRGLMIAAGSFCLLCAVVYLLFVGYYSEGFALNTWINGVYCTGKNIEEVNSELLLKTEAPSIVIVDKNGREWKINGNDIDYIFDYSESLRSIKESQSPYAWIVNLGQTSKRELEPIITYDEDKLEALWMELPFVKEEQNIETTIEIVKTGDTYELINRTRKRLNIEKGLKLLKQELHRGENRLELSEEGLYDDVLPTSEQQDILEQWELVEAFQSIELVYDMGDEQVILDASNRGQFLIREEDGTFRKEADGTLAISEEMTNAFIDALADEYDTYGKEREFLSTRGDNITLKKGTYGTLIDRNAEKEYLYQALTEGISDTHIPEYKRKAYHRGKNDIGNTYIEIDMTNQKMYLYVEGECQVETDIVTGNTSKRWGTPEGIHYVYAKQKNRILRGTGYASFVNYWMPVNGNIGIHDAGWRSTFGGEIYKKSGSHGCINTPYNAMKEIYDTVEIGIPVIIFY